MNGCLACGKYDDRIRLQALWCMSCYVLSEYERLQLAIQREKESDAVEGYERAA